MLQPELRLLSSDDYQEVKRVFLNHIFPEYGKKSKRGREGAFDRMLFIRRVNFDYSAGAFINGQLIGFALMGVGIFEEKKSVYASGTGILVPYRRQGFASRLVEFLVNQLPKKSVEQALVTTQPLNNKGSASQVYRNAGFKYQRLLYSYKMSSKNINLGLEASSDVNTKIVASPSWKLYSNWHKNTPSWERVVTVIEMNAPYEVFLEAYQEDQCVGFLIRYGKISQIGSCTSNLEEAILIKLIQHFYDLSQTKRLKMLSIDEQELTLVKVFKKLGFLQINKLEELKLTFS